MTILKRVIGLIFLAAGIFFSYSLVRSFNSYQIDQIGLFSTGTIIFIILIISCITSAYYFLKKWPKLEEPSMPTFISHIVLADKAIHHFPNIDKAEYFCGTIFPDISYLKVIPREKTHLTDLKIDQNDSSFIIGMKVHAIVDQKREEFIIKNGLYEKYDQLPEITTGLKLYEDIILYNKISNWQEIINYLKNFSDEEKDYDISHFDLVKWHSLIIDYIKQRPDDQSRLRSLLSIGYSNRKSINLNNTVNQLIEKKPDYALKLYKLLQ